MDYDDTYRKIINVFGSEPERVLKDHIHLLDRGEAVLDVGAGQGRNAFYLAGEGFSVHALDPSEVAVEAMKEMAAGEKLPLEVFHGTFDGFESPEAGYGGVMVFGLIQILTRESITLLLEKISAWTREDGLVFITGFTTKDPAYAGHAAECREMGRNSFADMHGKIRTYLEPGEVLELFPGYKVIHHGEGMGPEHRHGKGAPEKHAMVEAVLRR